MIFFSGEYANEMKCYDMTWLSFQVNMPMIWDAMTWHDFLFRWICQWDEMLCYDMTWFSFQVHMPMRWDDVMFYNVICLFYCLAFLCWLWYIMPPGHIFWSPLGTWCITLYDVISLTLKIPKTHSIKACRTTIHIKHNKYSLHNQCAL